MKFGLMNLIEYRVGDEVRWLARKAVHNGGRPPGGDLDAKSFGICPACDAALQVVVLVRADHIRGVEAGSERLAFAGEPSTP